MRRETPATVSQRSHDGELIPVLPEFEFPIGTFDSDQILYLVEAGKAATEQSLPYLHRLLQEPAADQPSLRDRLEARVPSRCRPERRSAPRAGPVNSPKAETAQLAIG